MTPHETDLRFAAEIARMKKLIIEKNRRDGRWLLVAAVAGLVVAALFGMGDELAVGCGFGGIVSVIVIVIWKLLTDIPPPIVRDAAILGQ